MRPPILACRLVLLAVLLLPLAAADLIIGSGGYRVSYCVLEDEVHLVPRLGGGAPRIERIREALHQRRGAARVRLSAAAPAVQGFAARAREVERLTGGEAWAVLRLPGQREDAEPTLLTRWVTLRLRPGTDIAEVVAGLPLAVVRQEPWDLEGRTWVCRATGDEPLAAVQAAELARRRAGVAWAEPVLRHPVQRKATNDPLLPQQRHLGAETPSSINAIAAWQARSPRLTGRGVVINVNDSGIDAEHEDLAPNLLKDAGFSYRENQQRSVLSENDNHGTVCAGLAAACGDNGIGVAGVAYAASIVDVQHLGDARNETPPYPGDIEAALMAHNIAAARVDFRPWITSNSWGPDAHQWQPISNAMRAAFANAARAREGRGVVHVFAIGNEREQYEVQNMNAQQNNEYVISVGALDWNGRQAPYSNCSASLFVCAPGGLNDQYKPNAGIVSTDRSQPGVGYAPSEAYTDSSNGGGGTSWATPMVAGVVALMLEANPRLTYRDVMHILARHSDMNDPDNAGAEGDKYADTPWDDWRFNGAAATEATDAAVVRYSNRYGFGKVNALHAVTVAQHWWPVPQRQSYETTMMVVNQPIPDPTALATVIPFDPADSDRYVFSTITVTEQLVPERFRIERVLLRISMRHERAGDLSWHVRSPQGTIGTIGQRNKLIADDSLPNDEARHQDLKERGDRNPVNEWTFVLNTFWGESALGPWTLYVQDHLAGDTGWLVWWQLCFVGYHECEAPSFTVSEDAVVTQGATSITVQGSGFVRNDAGEPLTRFFINGEELPPEQIQIRSEQEVRLTLPHAIDWQASAITIEAENYRFVSQFTGEPGVWQAPQVLRSGKSRAIIPINHPPQLLAGQFVAWSGQPLRGRWQGWDIDNDALVFTVVSAPQHGQLRVLDAAQGTFEYRSEAGYQGSDSFTVRVTDEHGASSAVVTMSVTVRQSGTADEDRPSPPSPTDPASQYGQGGGTSGGGCLAGSGLLALIAGLGLVLLRMPSLRRRG